ncbi:MAG: bifunctional phosphoribosyl-AMP cyclohydrolase/phosphoribosyl-ATP diphosphatase HisIE [Candidatus Gracilibacteria bacterium]|jgi:phosphoribosyl-ATP pyrophosphohydrolase/phosphoribosyl-AMP cyclohydrolase
MKNIIKNINWKKVNGLIPAIIQDAKTGRVLMIGYMNETAFKRTIKTKKVWFFSRTKNRLWQKGEKSGNFLKLLNIRPDCDMDALLISAIPSGPTCHTGTESCFGQNMTAGVLDELYSVIQSRFINMPKKSYTTFLFKKGIDKICAKIAEESGEVIKAAQKETKKRLTEESVDLLYHLFALLVAKKIEIKDVLDEAFKRRK